MMRNCNMSLIVFRKLPVGLRTWYVENLNSQLKAEAEEMKKSYKRK